MNVCKDSVMQFQIIFDGEGLTHHEMSPKELSVALVAMDNLLTEANAVLNDKKTTIKLTVKGSFETGCFIVNFAYSLLDQAKDLLTYCGVSTNSNLTPIDIITLIFGKKIIDGINREGLVGVIKFLCGRRPTKIFENEDKTLSIYRGEKFIKTEKEIYKLYQNYKIRKSFEQLTSPIRDNRGINDLAIKSKDIESNFCVINKEEIDYFKCPESELVSIEQPATYNTVLSIVEPSFKDGNKWYVNDGDSSFYVLVEDSDFLNKIDQKVVGFFKGDLWKVKIRKEQFYDKNSQKLKSEYYVEQVFGQEIPPELFDQSE
jgi:hypothetical protein